MKLHFVNPNATAEMTRRMVEQARNLAPQSVEVTGATNTQGPAAIQGQADGDAAEPGTLALLAAGGFDLAVIGCFDDTGLPAARRSSPVPILGLGQASFIRAHEQAAPFIVLTTSALSVPVLEANITGYGLQRHCLAVVASGVPVLDFEHDRASARSRLVQAAKKACAEYSGTRTLVLGCAGMGGLATDLSQELNLPVIDPIEAALTLSMKTLKRTCKKSA